MAPGSQMSGDGLSLPTPLHANVGTASSGPSNAWTASFAGRHRLRVSRHGSGSQPHDDPSPAAHTPRWWKIRFFQGMINDIRRRAPFYWSDWADAWNYRVVPATVYMYFAKYAALFSVCAMRAISWFRGFKLSLFRRTVAYASAILQPRETLPWERRSIYEPFARPLLNPFLHPDHSHMPPSRLTGLTKLSAASFPPWLSLSICSPRQTCPTESTKCSWPPCWARWSSPSWPASRW